MWLANSRAVPSKQFRGRPAATGLPMDRGEHRSARPRLEPLEQRTLLSTFTVTDNSDNPTDPGSLRYAILNAPGGTTINFAPSAAGTITLTHGALDVKTNLDIEGPGARGLTIDGNKASSVFNIAPGVNTTIAAVTIANGKSAEGGGINNAGTLRLQNTAVSNSAASHLGGGIYSTGTLTLAHSTLSDDTAFDEGGGIFNRGTLFITNSVVSSNRSTSRLLNRGGGVFNTEKGKLAIVASSVQSNAALIGGGIFNRGNLSVTYSAVSNNTAFDAAGIDNWAHTATLTNCTVANNRAASGPGGIANRGTMSLTNCTVANNSAGDGGGGIINGKAMTLTNCTVADNSAREGGGVFSNHITGRTTIVNTIIAGNRATNQDHTAPDAIGPYASLGHNLIGDTEGSHGWTNSDLKNANPLLAPLAENGGPTLTMALSSGSPAIASGDVTFITNPPFPSPAFTDQRGLARIKNGQVDIGAFQTQ